MTCDIFGGYLSPVYVGSHPDVTPWSLYRMVGAHEGSLTHDDMHE